VEELKHAVMEDLDDVMSSVAREARGVHVQVLLFFSRPAFPACRVSTVLCVVI
jgi:hypothetical protein